MNTSSRCGTRSVHAAREVLPSGAVTSLKLVAGVPLASGALVRITQRPPRWSASYSTSRSRGASTVNSRGSAAGAQRNSLDTVLSTPRSEEHTSELQSLMRLSYAVFCLKKKKTLNTNEHKQRYS